MGTQPETPASHVAYDGKVGYTTAAACQKKTFGAMNTQDGRISMNPKWRKVFGIVTLTLVFSIGGSVSPLMADEYEKHFFLKGKKLELFHLIGEIQLVPAEGDRFEVTVAIRGEEATPDILEFDAEEGRTSRLFIHFPIEKNRRFVYPPMGANSKATISHHWEEAKGSNWFRRILCALKGNHIKVSGRGSGLEVWADVTLAVPRGLKAEVRHGVGRIDADRLIGDFSLDIQTGPVNARHIEGDLNADTGSGGVTVENTTGKLTVDTGSGGVVLKECSGKSISVDTGSGSVTAKSLACERLVIDTGSGGVIAHGVQADQAKVDTGSGGVELHLDRIGTGRFVVDTGSGSIDVKLPLDASAEISADTSSGMVIVEVEGIRIRKSSRSHAEFTLGGGDARVLLDAGSGSIRIHQ
jgi:hypothetical protein